MSGNFPSTLAGEFTPKSSYDVCIIGSGAGGAVTAAVLAQAGFSVIVLEEGRHFSRPDFNMHEDWAMPALYQEQGLRTTKDGGVSILQGRAVGGSTVVNWTTSFRTPETTLDHWKKVHAVNGFAKSDLDPHWDLIEERLNIKPISLDETNRNNRTLYDGCKALGLQVDTTRRNTRNCMKSGYCGMGCPVDAKQSMLVTFLPEAVQKGAQLVSRCRVDKLRVEAGRVVAAECTALADDGYLPSGKTLEVRANRFVLAGGAMNSPAVLMRSGLGGGMVGKRTFLHPVVFVVSEWKEPIEPYYGAPQSVASHALAHRGVEVGLFLEAAPLHPMLTSVVLPGFGAQHDQLMARLPYLSAHIALGIDGFHPSETGGTVELRQSGAAALDYPLPPRIYQALREGLKTLVKIDRAAGALRSYSPHDPPLVIERDQDIAKLDDAPMELQRVSVGSAHVMGGCMMGDDAAKSVVRSSDLRHHTLQNLHVVDGSVFPTSLGVNPQESIYGLAHLMATRFTSDWKR